MKPVITPTNNLLYLMNFFRSFSLWVRMSSYVCVYILAWRIDHGPIAGPGSADFKIPDHVPPSPEAPRSRPAPSTGHSSYGFSNIVSAFLKNPEIFDFDVDNLQNLLRVYSSTPPSCPVYIYTGRACFLWAIFKE